MYDLPISSSINLTLRVLESIFSPLLIASVMSSIILCLDLVEVISAVTIIIIIKK